MYYRDLSPSDDDLVLWVPAHLRSVPLGNLRLGARVRTALFRSHFHWVGDLHERTEKDVLEIENLGPVGLRHLVERLETVGGRRISFAEARALRDRESSGELPMPDEPAFEPLVSVPDAYRNIVLNDLIWPLSLGSFRNFWPHLRTVGDLAGMAADVVMETIAPERVHRTRVFFERLTAIPIDRLDGLGCPRPSYRWWWWNELPGEETDIRVPRLKLPILAGVAAAETLEDEIRALGADLSVRNAGLFFDRLPFDRVDRPTLRALGESVGVSANRVSQIVRARIDYLESSGLRLRIGSRVVEVLASAAEPLGTDAFLCRLEAEGLPQRAEVIHALPTLSRIELVPEIRYWSRTDEWLPEAE